MPFKDWLVKMKKENPEGLKEYWRVNKQRQRAKLKVEKQRKQAQEINQQYKAGNINFGVHAEAPKPMSWSEYKKQNPTCDFWDYLDYRKSLKKPTVEKLTLQHQKDDDYERENLDRIIMKMEDGELPNHVQLGFNFHHPEQEKSSLDLIEEKENTIKAQIKDWYNKLKL